MGTTVRYVADIHIHSRFARATSRDLNAPNLHRWSALKGVTVVGTGDFTHPEWLAELKDHLVPAEPGLYRLKDELLRDVEADLYPGCRNDVRFVLSSEISLIYKKDDKTRKVHHVIVMPDFDAVDRLNARLDEIGNLKSDGRPILGLDSRDLVEICLEACEGVLFIPAHIWTPHFAALGASSGFDTLEACFGDMLSHIFTIETGLSSDPPMNWRLSMLDRYAIVSNSDAHSPQKLAREGTCLNTDLSFSGMYEALKSNDPVRLEGTLEFFPEQGKYHLDGHRKCGVRWHPSETLAADGLCPECGKKLTVGVLHRVELLADRPEGERPSKARPFESLVPLKEVIGSAMGVGPTSKRVDAVYHRLLGELGPELEILRSVPVEDIAICGEPLVAEGVRRMRVREVTAIGGFDGEYGTIQVLSADDRERLRAEGTEPR
jgi:DNA helicase II / ATP-dependent DNA helicase PcrA